MLLVPAVQPGDTLVHATFSTEPRPEAPLCDPTVILVPLLAFDRLGQRLGQGGGFYDRTLAVRPEVLPSALPMRRKAARQRRRDPFPFARWPL